MLKCSMTKKPDTITIVAAIAATAVAGIAAYLLYRTKETVKELEDVLLDFGNDDVLLSAFKQRKTKD